MKPKNSAVDDLVMLNHGTAGARLTPAMIAEAALSDMRKKASNRWLASQRKLLKSRGEPKGHLARGTSSFAFAVQHVRAAKTARELIELALSNPEIGEGTMNPAIMMLYRHRAELMAASELASREVVRPCDQNDEPALPL